MSLPQEAPSSFNQHIFGDVAQVYYGTDDGYQDGSFGEFAEIEAAYGDLDPARRENVHMVSAVGGLYGLNLLPLWRPKEVTFFDINSHAMAYFQVVRRVFAISSSKGDFLDRLKNQDYEVETDEEVFIRENFAMKERGELPKSRGSSNRSCEASWQYALDHFDITKTLLTEVNTRIEGLESPAFAEFFRTGRNLWLYCSNIVEFKYMKLRFDHPSNVILLSIVYPGQVDLLDLAPFGNVPVEVVYQIPMTASVVGQPPFPPEVPSALVDEKVRRLAELCRNELGLSSDDSILDIGCSWGPLGQALTGYLDGRGRYEGLDPQREHVQWAQRHVTVDHANFKFHIANIRNKAYKPNGTLDPTAFRFPYADGSFDVVVAFSVFPYMLPEEFEHYVSEAQRVLKPGGRFMATFFLVNETLGPSLPYGQDPLRFRYRTGSVITEGPNRRGLGAYDEDFVRASFASDGFKLGEPCYGSWAGCSESGLVEDYLIGTKPSA